MKELKILIISIFIVNLFLGCEKDDICEAGTPTTPRMIIEFYDNLNPNTKKAITNLGIVADGLTTGILYDAVSTIPVPLKTNTDITKFSFILDSKNIDPLLRNEDKININYTRTDVFISRACGFKTVFKLNTANAITQDIDPKKWIKEIQIKQNNILNETEVHVKIFF